MFYTNLKGSLEVGKRRHVKITLRRVKIRHLKWLEFRFIMNA